MYLLWPKLFWYSIIAYDKQYHASNCGSISGGKMDQPGHVYHKFILNHIPVLIFALYFI